MQKVTLNIEGTLDEVVAALQGLGRLFVVQEDVEQGEEVWSEQEILEFWNLLTGGAKEALRVIAKQPDGYPRNDVLQELGIAGNQLAGQLSSVGHARRRLRTKRRPVRLNEDTWKYEMIPELSGAIIKLSL